MHLGLCLLARRIDSHAIRSSTQALEEGSVSAPLRIDPMRLSVG